MFGKFGDMLGKLNEIKQKIAEIKIQLDTLTTQVTSANGDIKITINGNRKIQKLEITQSLQSASKDELEKELTIAFNKAVAEADKLSENEMKKVAGGMLPPGLF